MVAPRGSKLVVWHPLGMHLSGVSRGERDSLFRTGSRMDWCERWSCLNSPDLPTVLERGLGGWEPWAATVSASSTWALPSAGG